MTCAGPCRQPLRFRQATVPMHYSSGNTALLYTGHKAAAVTVAPLQSAVVFVRI